MNTLKKQNSVRRRDWIYRAWKFRILAVPLLVVLWGVAGVNVLRNPRIEALHGSDVVSLLGYGACFGAGICGAIILLLRILRRGVFK